MSPERTHRPDYPYANPPRLPEGEEVPTADLLGGEGPLEIEIGPGRGAFVVERAAAAPEHRVLGLEIRRKWAQNVDERLGRLGLHPRVRVLCEDAKLALPRLVPDASVARFFVSFPDPWWKKRHQKRLVVVDPLVDQILRLLVDDGELFVQTDVPERFDEYRARLDAKGELEPAGDEPGSPVIADNPYGALSNRERRAAQDGLPVYRLRYRRRRRNQ
ncbi:MAG: tRNA (guanine-N7)-methyltransferase [Polyangiaceae bacterium]